MANPATDKPLSSDNHAPEAPHPFPNPRGHVEFYRVFKHEADEYDNDFVGKHHDQATTTLIFAGIISVVTSIFIVNVQSQLQPDYTQMSYALLTIIASTSLWKIPTVPDAVFPQWTGPDPVVVRVQAILCSSFAASVLAAFIAMLGKQWLNHYSQIEMHGSVIDRSRHRERKINGMITWRFHLVMECPPLMLQVALLLLGYALSNYLLFINEFVAGTIIGFSAFGLLFYSLIVSAATLSRSCPFKTPLSIILRSLISSSDEHVGYLEKHREWLGRMFPREKKQSSKKLERSHAQDSCETFDENNIDNRIKSATTAPPDQQPPLFIRETDWRGYVLDSNCIAWMFQISLDPDVILAIMKFIPEVVWHAGIRTIPLERLYDTLFECFDRSTGHLVVIPKLRNKAYFSARALLHLAIQRKCIGHESDQTAFESISNRHQVMGFDSHQGDSDLESTLGIVDRVFGHSDPMSWQDFSFTTPHHAWMSHIILHRAWDIVRKGEDLPDDVREFVLHSLRLDPLPPTLIISDCLFVIGLILGIKLHPDDLLITDKSRELDPQITRIYEKLVGTFQNPDPTTDGINRAIEAMELIAPLSTNEVATKSYHLFHVVMQAPLSPAHSQEKKWQAARLAMYGAYKWDRYLPWVEDPQDILTFLYHHFDLATIGGQNQDEPIQYALGSLGYASSPVTVEALKHFDPTGPLFIRGLCYAFQEGKPFQLRKAALFFLPLVSSRWFNSPDPIMELDQMKRLCADWASAVDGIEHTYDIQKAALTVLFRMANSPQWRPHIVQEKWKLLEYFPAVPDDSQPLRECLDNPELTDAILKAENPVAVVLWLGILWLKYKELIPEVRERLEAAMKEITRRRRRTDIDMYLSLMDSGLKNAEGALAESYSPWSTDPGAMVLRAKIDNIRQAKVCLITFKGD